MKRLLWATLLAIAALRVAAEAEVKSRIESVGLFKNGLAVVRRTLQLPGSGRYVVRDLPAPVHGTFWIESPTPLRARVALRQVDLPNEPAGRDLAGELANVNVELFLRDQEEPVSGRVLPPPPPERSFDRDYEMDRRRYWRQPTPATAAGRFLVLRTGEGLLYVDQGQIRIARVRGGLADRQEEQPVLILENDRDGGAMAVRLTYLTKGLAWAPSYRIDLADNALSLVQKAVIRNELTELDGADVSLISGFPHIEFAHVDSPLAATTSWTQFFQQLNARPGDGSPTITQQAMVVSNTAMTIAPQFTMPGDAGGADLHYQEIGALRLGLGETLALETAAGKAPMRRVVEWTVPDNRDWDGSYLAEHRRRENPDRFTDAAWDAVRFTNPLGFPMTTAPAAVFEGGRFRAETQSFWINPGQEGTLRVTKALSVATRATEHELQQEGRRDNDYVYVGGRRFRKAAVEGTLSAHNHRATPIVLVIHRCFSGDLQGADGEPENTLREEGVYSINPRHELTWEVEVGAGKDVELNYSYSVLIPH